MSTVSAEVETETAKLVALAVCRIEDALLKSRMTRSELARRIGVPRSRVTKVLDGDANVTMETLVRFGLGCGVRFTIQAARGAKR